MADNKTPLDEARARLEAAYTALKRWTDEVPYTSLADIPAGTPNRRIILRQRQDQETARRLAPDRVARGTAIQAEIASAKRSLAARQAAARRAADPRTAIHAAIRRALVARGYTVERSDGGRRGSRYFVRWNGKRNDWDRLRIADHRVPLTEERRSNAEHGGFSWAQGGNQVVITDYDNADEAVAAAIEIADAKEEAE